MRLVRVTKRARKFTQASVLNCPPPLHPSFPLTSSYFLSSNYYYYWSTGGPAIIALSLCKKKGELLTASFKIAREKEGERKRERERQVWLKLNPHPLLSPPSALFWCPDSNKVVSGWRRPTPDNRCYNLDRHICADISVAFLLVAEVKRASGDSRAPHSLLLLAAIFTLAWN